MEEYKYLVKHKVIFDKIINECIFKTKNVHTEYNNCDKEKQIKYFRDKLIDELERLKNDLWTIDI